VPLSSKEIDAAAGSFGRRKMETLKSIVTNIQKMLLVAMSFVLVLDIVANVSESFLFVDNGRKM
jgi:hypothetical protein